MTDNISKVVPPVHAATFVPSFSEAARRLGMAQAQGNSPATAYWQGIVDAHETAAKAALRDLDAVCDEATALPAVPEGWAPDVSNGGQVSVGDASHTPGRKLWHTDPHGRFWTGYTGTRTAQQLIAECESTIRDLRALLAATPAHDQPEGSDNG